MVIIPEGYREINPGEIILKTDLVCPKDKNKFLKLRFNNLAIGKAYKTEETYKIMFPETVIIRQVELPKINVWCENINKYPGAYELIDGLIQNHINFRKYRFSSYHYGNFYIITEINGENENYIGYTGDSKVGNFRNLKNVSYPELIKILGGTMPVQKPFRIIIDISVRLKDC